MPLPNHKMLLVLAVSLGIAFSGTATAQVPDGVWEIVDKNDSGTTAIAIIDGAAVAADIDAVCVPFAETDSSSGSSIEAITDHPDTVKLKKDSGEVEQAEKSNQGTIRLVTGSERDQIVTRIDCKKLEIEASVNTKKSPNTGKFKVKASDCECPLTVGGSCDAFLSQTVILAADCSSHKSIKFDFSEKKGIIKKITISGKGDASLLE
jgi:hypothetical protein